ncbi:MAG: asparagine synthase (glutamine-hydrolyzing) [Bacteroidia bacterium]|nr:asparagine synthase (glutamine-hydrolyzing) [Bacteroidia bacterium]
MCGIIGAYKFRNCKLSIQPGIQALQFRGPDGNGFYESGKVQLGQARLAIIDITEGGKQPMSDPSGRFTITFNGEIFNYRELKQELQQKGIRFHSESDTEVLLHLFIQEKEAAFSKLNGFFAFAVWDSQKEKLTIVRDRFGIKPLLIYQDEEKIIFGSEMKALLACGIPKALDIATVQQFLQFNYVPPDSCIFKSVRKLRPGSFLTIQGNEVIEKKWYEIKIDVQQATTSDDYESKQKQLVELLDDSVQRRLIADVPLGVFLSGGIDSSVITALAARHKKPLHTFSISFDDPMFDESTYALAVANKFQTEHTVFRLKYDELRENLFNVLDYIDEPFADASAINFYLLSKYTRKKVTVALSGDGADELFGGYSKHYGEYRARQKSLLNLLIKFTAPILNLLPDDRSSAISRKLFQIKKYANGLSLSPHERYWQWAQILPNEELQTFFNSFQVQELLNRKNRWLKAFSPNGDMNEVFWTDMHLVLQGDMLTKVDLMSMANSLEVRVPFLDYRVVEFAFRLPVDYKINHQLRKRIVQDAFRSILPPELYNRPKQGFEVPLRSWFLSELKAYIQTEILNRERIEAQGIFRFDAIQRLVHNIEKSGSGKEDWTLWAIIVFQHWYKRYFDGN